jgi:hypothetical protein
MRRKITTALLVLSLFGAANASTNKCGMLIGFAPGGAADKVARLFQKYNPDFRIEYKPGGNGVIAVNYLADHTDYVYLANPAIDDTPIEVYKILSAPSNIVVTGKSTVDLDKLLTGKISIGYATTTTPGYVIAQQLAKANPNSILVPTVSDVKALPMLINGDLDVYVANIISAGSWTEQFPQLKNVLTIEFNKPFVKGNIKVESLGFTGLLLHKNASEANRQHAINCVEKALSHPGLVEELKAWNSNPVLIGGKEKDLITKRFIELRHRLGN